MANIISKLSEYLMVLLAKPLVRLSKNRASRTSSNSPSRRRRQGNVSRNSWKFSASLAGRPHRCKMLCSFTNQLSKRNIMANYRKTFVFFFLDTAITFVGSAILNPNFLEICDFRKHCKCVANVLRKKNTSCTQNDNSLFLEDQAQISLDPNS